MTEPKPTNSPGRSRQTRPAADDQAVTNSQSQYSMETSSSGAPPQPPQPPTTTSGASGDELPESFGRYKIEKLLGKGAMGVVYLAIDTQLDRHVALKIPNQLALSTPDALHRFYREARTTATLRHNNICQVYDVGEVNGAPYLTMEYVPGKTISTYINKAKLPAPRQVALLIRKIALALDLAHGKGVIHRDLKPANVMLDDQGEPKVMDFGLACQLNTTQQARITQSGAILGTPAYMSPEQVRGELDQIGPQSDMYSLGVMLYQLLTGELPFGGPTLMVFAKILTEEPLPPSALKPDVDAALEAICVKMMAKAPAERYASMKDVAAELTDYIKHQNADSQRLLHDSSRFTARTPPPQAWASADSPDAEAAQAGLALVSEPRRTTVGRSPGRRSRRIGKMIIGLMLVLCAVVIYCSVFKIVVNSSALVLGDNDHHRIEPLKAVKAEPTKQNVLETNIKAPKVIDLLRLLSEDRLSQRDESHFLFVEHHDDKENSVSIPYQPPEEYDADIRLIRRKVANRNKRNLGIGLRGFLLPGRRIATFYLDGNSGSGMAKLDGRDYKHPEVHYDGKLFRRDIQSSIMVQVRKSTIKLFVDGTQIVNFAGDFNRLESLDEFNQRHSFPIGQPTFKIDCHESSFEITGFRIIEYVKPVDPAEETPRTDDRVAPMDSVNTAQSGLRLELYTGRDFNEKVGETTAKNINSNDWPNRWPDRRIPRGPFSLRWTGRLKVDDAGRYRFATVSDDGIRVWLDGEPIIDHWKAHAPMRDEIIVDLTRGCHDIKVEYKEIYMGEWRCELLWAPPNVENPVEVIVPASAFLMPADEASVDVE